jgi:CRP/FNR family transcriptional regulator
MSPEIREKIHAFFSQYPKRVYPKGQILIFGDESPQHVFFLAKGKVRKYDISYRGDEVIVNVFQSPAFFPMSWALNRYKNRYFYKTEEPTEVYIAPADDTVEFLRANADVTLDFLSRLYKGMEGLLGRMVHLMSGTAKSRLAYELIIECRRFGKKQPDGSVLLSANESDIAARSGLSRETVSREIHKLKAQKLVSVDHGGISILDPAALQKLHGVEY